jgi:hypothetical protein
LLERLVDSPVRGFAYEAVGTVQPDHLAAGRELVERAAQRWRIPAALLDRRRDEDGWSEWALGALSGLLTR